MTLPLLNSVGRCEKCGYDWMHTDAELTNRALFTMPRYLPLPLEKPYMRYVPERDAMERKCPVCGFEWDEQPAQGGQS